MATNTESIFPVLGSQEKTLKVLIITTLSITMVVSFSEALGLLGDIMVFSAYLVLLFYYSLRYHKIQLPVLPVFLISIIYTLFVIGLLRYFMKTLNFPVSSLGPISAVTIFLQLGEIIGYILASFVLIFVVPHVFDRVDFFKFFSIFSSFCVLIGMPAYFIGDFSISFLYINTYTTIEPFRQFGINIPALSSVWNDANAMSKIAMTGIFGSHYCYMKYKNPVYQKLIILNIIGLFLANSKMAIISITIAYSVYFVYIYSNKSSTKSYLIFGSIFGSATFFMIVFTDILNPFVVLIGFQSRVELWRASISTFLHHPLLGTGIYNVGTIISDYTGVPSLAPQNSYLRIIVSTGVFGGLSYIYLLTSTVFKYFSNITSKYDLLLLTLFISFLLLQFTDTADMFGVNKNSAIIGLTLGYIFQDIYFDNSSSELLNS